MHVQTVVFLSFIAAVASTGYIVTYRQLGPYPYQYIRGPRAIIPLCFPYGFPNVIVPIGSCYKEGFRGSISSRAGPCLPPLINGQPFPPCNGLHFTLVKFG